MLKRLLNTVESNVLACILQLHSFSTLIIRNKSKKIWEQKDKFTKLLSVITIDCAIRSNLISTSSSILSNTEKFLNIEKRNSIQKKTQNNRYSFDSWNAERNFVNFSSKIDAIFYFIARFRNFFTILFNVDKDINSIVICDWLKNRLIRASWTIK